MKRIYPVWLSAIVLICLNQSVDSKELLKTEGSNSSDVVPSYRLPNETYPEHYDITITTDVHLGETAFQGEVTIDIVVVNETNNIVLHAKGMQISKVSIVNPSAGETEELSHEYELEREFLTFRRKSGNYFKAGTKWKLAILYNGQLRDDLQGFHLLKYVDDGKDRYMASTYFGYTYARHAFPCYDEPAKRANFTITINHSPNLQAISNMPVNENKFRAGKTVFQTTARISVDSVAFMVGDMRYTEVNFDGIRQRVYSRPSRKGDHQFSLNISMLSLKYFSEYFGIDYMISKYDQVAVTKHRLGGVESCGLGTFSEYNLLYNTNHSSFSQYAIALNVANALALQWLGIYVATQWWSNVWLTAGLAELISYHAIDKTFPKFGAWGDFHIRKYQRALVDDAVGNSVPLTVYVNTPSDAEANYKELKYFKGASILCMWQNALGEEIFRRAIHNLLRNNQYSAVTEEDLYEELQKSAEIDNIKLPASISKMMKTWTHQGGYPILTVSRDYNDGSFTVKQEVYRDDETSKEDRTWYVPINFAVASKPDFSDTNASHYLVDSNEIKVDAQLTFDDWIILNKGSQYFYRIIYDEENYKRITQTLIEQPFTIHPRNRAQLLDDACRSTFSNRLDHRLFLKMLTYLKKEDQYEPWISAKNILNNHYNKLIDNAEFKQFVRDLVKPIFEKMGAKQISGENPFYQELRGYIIDLACKHGLRECLEETSKNLKARLMENSTTVESEYQSLCWGVSQADDNVFNILFQRFMEQPEKRVYYEYYMSFAQNESHIRKYISSSIDMSNKLLPKDRYNLLGWVYSRNEKSLLVCIDFLIENLDAYRKLQVGSHSHPLADAIAEIANHVVSEEAKEKHLTLLAKIKASKHFPRKLESVVRSRIEKNNQWIREYGETTVTWLSQHYSKSVSQL